MVQQATTTIEGPKKRTGGVGEYQSPFKKSHSSDYVGFGLAALFRESPYWEKAKALPHVSEEKCSFGKFPMTSMHFTLFSPSDKGGLNTVTGIQCSVDVSATDRPQGDWLSHQQEHAEFFDRVGKESKDSASAIAPSMVAFMKEIVQRIPGAAIEGGNKAVVRAINLPTCRVATLKNVTLDQLVEAADALGREWHQQKQAKAEGKPR